MKHSFFARQRKSVENWSIREIKLMAKQSHNTPSEIKDSLNRSACLQIIEQRGYLNDLPTNKIGYYHH
jgi:hypothetical protein